VSDPKPTEHNSRSTERFIGAALMAIGGLVATLCGACTAIFTVGSLASALRESGSSAASLFMMALVIGGVPTLAGVFVFRTGLQRYRGASAGKSGLEP
jgi:hypothetical protein